MTDKPFVVVNPKSAGGKTKDAFAAIRTALEKAVGEVEVAFTERPKHGIELARKAADDGHSLVVAVGGDGTVNEVVNGLMQAKTRADLGIIPQGTGGDFRRSLDIEHRLDKYCAALAAARTRPLDVGKATLADGSIRWFVNIVSLGMGGLVDRYVAESSRPLGGTVAYFSASLRALVNSTAGNVVCEVTLDGKTEERKLRTLSMAICNGQYFGGGMQIAPMARLDDGVFDVISLGAGNKLAWAARSVKVYGGTHVESPEVEHFRCSKITVTLANDDARETFLVDFDGEPLGPIPITLEAVPGALRVRI